jgi:glycosyltransferase involved in cell wall biosynthesis
LVKRAVLHTEWSLGWGGQEIRIVAEMRAFSERGYRMELACRAGSCVGEEAARAGFAVHHLGFRGPLDLVTALRLARLARSRDIRLIHTHSSVDGWCGGLAGKLAGIPVVRSRHLASAVRAGLNARLVYGWLAQRVISSGRHIRDELLALSGADPARHVSIPAGADATRFHPGVDAAAVRGELGIDAADQVVGIVAVLRSWKGHEILIEACERALPRLPRLRLLIVGEGPIRGAIEAKLALSPIGARTKLLGHRDDVPALMRAMGVCVLPSLKNEATSQVMPQAMLAGTPVICSSAGGLTEVVEDGVTGRIVAPGDVEALARALVAVWAEPERTRAMAERARAHALERLTFERQIQATDAVYRDLL